MYCLPRDYNYLELFSADIDRLSMIVYNNRLNL